MKKPFHFPPEGKSLSLIVVIFVAIVVALLLVNNERSKILSGVRAYVAGEGFYSKGQKDAVDHLVRYAQSHAASDYTKYERALAIPLGSRAARLELEKPNPNLALVTQGFIAGHNHPDDIPNMIMLFRRFRHVSYMAKAINAWAEGDVAIEQLQQLGNDLHTSITSGQIDSGRVEDTLRALEALNDRLTELEDEFSHTLGEANRWLERRLLQATYAATVFLLVTGVFLSWMILRQVRLAERERKHEQALAEARARQHEAIAHLGETALSGRDLQSLMDEATMYVTRTLGTDMCAVLELMPDNRTLRLQAGLGWKPGWIGHATVDIAPGTDAAYTLASAVPVIIEDLRGEMRFSGSPLLQAHAAVSGMSVVIAGQGGHHYGVLGSYATAPRSFTPDDINFFCTVANVLGVAVQRKRAEEALQDANRQKDDFLSMLAHELRNPLSPIRSAVHLLRRLGSKEPVMEQALDMIGRQVTHMTRLVDDLLDVSRVARGKISLRTEVVDLTQLVRLAGEDHRSSLQAKALQLTLAIPDQPIWVRGDPTRLSQAVSNLLHNAAKFTDADGHVTVKLTAEADGGTAVLRVCDTGIGMEPELLHRIFEPFTQADHSLERSRGGLGLGLALVKGLAELHGGSVEAFSAGRGKGSEFTLRLPLEPEAPSRVVPRVSETAQPRACRVLVIEDNLDVAESMKALLEVDGHHVAVAHTGAAGIETARRFRPTVVLCDLGLPGGMDGFAVAKAMRSDAMLQSAYLIALTGYGQQEDRRRAHDAGFQMHLIKPVDPALLEQVLTKVSARVNC